MSLTLNGWVLLVYGMMLLAGWSLVLVRALFNVGAQPVAARPLPWALRVGVAWLTVSGVSAVGVGALCSLLGVFLAEPMVVVLLLLCLAGSAGTFVGDRRRELAG